LPNGILNSRFFPIAPFWPLEAFPKEVGPLATGLFSDDAVSEVRGRSSILEVVSDYVNLKKTGKNHKGLCPFHTEKTPSFMVNEEKQIFHCFGCGEGGDVFTSCEGRSLLISPSLKNWQSGMASASSPRTLSAPKKETARREILPINRSP
jgi:DNA primase